MPPRLGRRPLLALIALFLASGCTSATDSDADIVGMYVLSTVNGSPLPYTQTTGNTSVRFNSGSLNIEGSGTFVYLSETVTTFGTTSTPVSARIAGTWTRNGSSLSMNPTSFTVNGQAQSGGSQTAVAQLGDNRITMQDPGSTAFVYVFVKQ